MTDTRSAELLHDHWQWRPDWEVDRPYLLWYVDVQAPPGLADWLAETTARWRDEPVVDPVPLEWLHLTLDDVEFTDRMSPERTDEVVAAARNALDRWPASSLTLGPVGPMGDAVVLHAGDDGQLARVRDRLRAATAQVLGPGALTELQTFDPHVSVGYVNDTCDPRRLLDPLDDLRDREFNTIVHQVTLAAVTRRDRHYQWLPYDTIALDHERAAAPA